MLQFAIVFSDRARADEAVDALGAHRSAVEVHESYPGWVVSAATGERADVAAAIAVANAVAARFRGEVVGHGGFTSFGMGRRGPDA